MSLAAVYCWGQSSAKVDCAKSETAKVERAVEVRKEENKKVRKIRTKLANDEDYRDSIRAQFDGL